MISNSKREIAGIVKSAAVRAGFDLVGLSKAARLDTGAVRLREWLDRGYHSGMNWMADKFEKRVDPGKVLDGAKSIVSLSRNYYTPADHSPDAAKISRYAWGTDYHLVIGKMLKRFVGELAGEFPGYNFLSYCDTGPVMDKVWAQRAGIGWIGKHTNVINENSGSWFFLAEVITDLECDYDVPAKDHCGSCRKCIDACPTGAIVEPYVLDANRCISYLTIENREPEIAPELASEFQNWVFGCDICQDVCPWNEKFQMPTSEEGFFPREDIQNLTLDQIHLMSREDFAERFKNSPVKRARHEGLVRNAGAIMNRAAESTRKEKGK